MSTTSLPRRVFLVIVTGITLTAPGRFGSLPLAFAADAAPDKEYVAVFRRGGNDQPFVIIEKPIGIPIGKGSKVEIDAFALRIATIDATQAKAFLRRLPALDAGESQKLPPGFTVYADKRYVKLAYAGASQTYKFTFTDPADVVGTGGGGGSGGGGGGSSM